MLSLEQQIFEQIKKANNILITFSKNRSGDAIASALALFLFLKKIEKNVEMIADNPDPKETAASLNSKSKQLSFLPEYQVVKNKLENLRRFIISLNTRNVKINQIKYKVGDDSLDFIISPKEGFFTHDDISSKPGDFKYDLIITLDTPDLESLGNIYDNDTEFFYHTPIINIDHHASNENYGQINFVELNAVSTTEILFSLFDSYSRSIIDEDIATCLLAGIISKTRNFKTPNITPHTLLTTSQLISMKANREEIVNRLYRSRSLNVLKLWGRILARLTGDLGNKLIWSTLSKNDFETTGSTENDLGDVIDELIVNIPEAKIIVLIYESLSENNQTDNISKTNIIVYTTTSVNSLDLIKEYSPIGTKGLAQASVNKPVQELEKIVIENIKSKLEKLPL